MKKYACTRPSLAAELVRQGFSIVRTEPSIWDSTRRAWIFDLTAPLAIAVNDYYRARYIDPPRMIQDTVARNKVLPE